MKPKAIIMTFSLGALLAINAHTAQAGMAGFAPRDTSDAPMLLAALSADELHMLRQQWRDLPPDEREKLRRKLRSEHGEGADEGFGMGFEFRRRDNDESARPDVDNDRSWGKPYSGDRNRDNRKGRR
jgi:hypothetical protein